MANTHTSDTKLKPSVAKPKPPAMYKVLLLNDDFTTMEFVIDVLQRFFNKSAEQSTQIMLKVHTEGVGICGIYPQDIAETKTNQVLDYAQAHQYPLQCIAEPV